MPSVMVGTSLESENYLKSMANKGIRVIVAGLDMDYKGNPFGPMPNLMATERIIQNCLDIQKCQMRQLRNMCTCVYWEPKSRIKTLFCMVKNTIYRHYVSNQSLFLFQKA